MLTLAGTLDITPITGFGTPIGGEQWLLMTYGGGLADMGISIVCLALASGLSYEIDIDTPGESLAQRGAGSPHRRSGRARPGPDGAPVSRKA